MICSGCFLFAIFPDKWYNKSKVICSRTYIARDEGFALIDISLISHNKGANNEH